MADMLDQITSDSIDAIRPDLEAFASLWSALRTNYQGTNITKTVARLLHMYQPEDGILAYERLLRTLYVLLEGFDGDGLLLLVSMVPPPKGVSEETIKEVFHKATGFARLNAPIFRKNNRATNTSTSMNGLKCAKIGNGNSESTPISYVEPPRLQSFINCTGSGIEDPTTIQAIVHPDPDPELPGKRSSPPKVPHSESELFRGFPSNELTKTQRNARNSMHVQRPPMKYGGCPLVQTYLDCHQALGHNESSTQLHKIGPSTVSSGYRVKWFEAPLLVRKNNYIGSPGCPNLILKTSDNKYVRLPITNINGPPINNSSSYTTSMQHSYQPYYASNHFHLRNTSINRKTANRDLTQSLSNPTKGFGISEKIDNSTFQNQETTGEKISQILDHNYELIKSDDNYKAKADFETENDESVNLESLSDKAIQKFHNVVKSRQRAIQEDIYRMDVVWSDEEIVQAPIDNFKCQEVNFFSVSFELKTSVQNFLKRVKEEKSSGYFPFLRTRRLQETCKFPTLSLKYSPRTWEMESLTKCSDDSQKRLNDDQLFIENPASGENIFSSTKVTTPVKDGSVNTVDAKTGKSSPAKRLERASRKILNSSCISINKHIEKTSAFGTAREMNDNADEENISAVEVNLRTISMTHQANSMTELVNFKKQYYDALLSIQRAKAAVANSLAISSAQTSTSCDPHTFQYLQQHHALLQQQQCIVTDPDDSVTHRSIVQPEMSNIRGATDMWIRSNCSFQQNIAPRQQEDTTLSSSYTLQSLVNKSKDSLIVKDILRSHHRVHRAPKTERRRNLEKIIGKLKETEHQD